MSSSGAVVSLQSSSNVVGSNGLASGGVMGGTNGGEKLPSMFIDRPKMPRATWEALRNHILKERQRKKQEQEQTEQVERQKKEREHKKKQEALTLEDTKEEISNLETKLAQLKEEKHQLFHTLKKVLYEDDRRRSKEASHPQMYLQPAVRPPTHHSAHYMKPHPQLLLAAVNPKPPVSVSQVQVHGHGQHAVGSHVVKRPRSPSPHVPSQGHRSGIPSAYYRQATTTVGSGNPGAKYTYASSAVASASPAAIYGVPSISSGSSGTNSRYYSVPVNSESSGPSGSKHIYLTQTQVGGGPTTSFRSSTITPPQPHQPPQPPAAHSTGLGGPPTSFRTSARMGSVYTNQGVRIAAPAPPSTVSNGTSQAPVGGVRYYTQREV